MKIRCSLDNYPSAVVSEGEGGNLFHLFLTSKEEVCGRSGGDCGEGEDGRKEVTETNSGARASQNRICFLKSAL